MLTLIIVESSLETVPKEIHDHPQIKKYSKKMNKKPKDILLDKSYHYRAMARLKWKEKRGRPDIVHFILLEALSSVLNFENLLQVYIHNLNDYIITVNPSVRLPRNYNRFTGLMEQLFKTSRIPASGTPLLILEKSKLEGLLHKIAPTKTVAFTRVGKPETPLGIAKKISEYNKPAIMIGGFPTGHFSSATLKLADEKICLDPIGLDAWVVVSRIISAYETVIGLSEKRIKQLKSSEL